MEVYHPQAELEAAQQLASRVPLNARRLEVNGAKNVRHWMDETPAENALRRFRRTGTQHIQCLINQAAQKMRCIVVTN